MPAWREVSTIFSPAGQAAWRWTEALTLVAQQGVSDEGFAAVAFHFQPEW